MNPSPTDGALDEALGCSPDDLSANRAGRMSDRQMERLRRAQRRTILVGGAVVLLLGLVAAVVLFLAQRNASAILQLVGVGVTIANAALVGVLVRNALRLSADLHAGRVSVLEGTATHTLRVTGRAASYLIRVNGSELSVAKPVFFAIEEGARYRFYRAPASGVLLAAERV